MDTTIQIITLLLVTYITYRVSVTNIKRRSQISGTRVFVDTSALMDGRIVSAARSGFIPQRLDIPKSVIAELQLLADQADSEKRARARGGLDVIAQLQEIQTLHVDIIEDGPLSAGGVDARLVELAKKHNGYVCTIDYNLNKVAVVEGVFVLNINELAKQLRMAYLPGERVSLQLVQKGQDAHQAVGYLDDGTMVVVSQAAKQVGAVVEVEFIRSLQTAAGRMMFAKLVDGSNTRGSTSRSAKGRKKVSPEDSMVELANG